MPIRCVSSRGKTKILFPNFVELCYRLRAIGVGLSQWVESGRRSLLEYWCIPRTHGMQYWKMNLEEKNSVAYVMRAHRPVVVRAYVDVARSWIVNLIDLRCSSSGRSRLSQEMCRFPAGNLISPSPSKPSRINLPAASSLELSSTILA